VKYLSEYRDGDIARGLVQTIRSVTTRCWVLMEVCGGQTHTIVRHGIDELLADSVELIHGPGCPVCVTPLVQIDRALALASRRDVIFTSFGDMLRVPGSKSDLQQVRAGGGDVRVVYSPLDALEIARSNPAREVVFFAVGFETTAPANAIESIPSWYPDGSRTLSKPPASARSTMSRQCSYELASDGSGTPRNS